MKNKKVIGFYDYTVILTYLGFIFAFVGILQVLDEHFTSAILCLISAGICDMFDGAVASTKDRDKYEKHFGIQIDSLCDLISFGILPALFVFTITNHNKLAGAIACFYSLAGLIRLAFYNVQEFERQQMTSEKRDCFLGLPITTSAIVLPLAYIAFEEFSFVRISIFPILLLFLGVGFITGIEIKKPKLACKIVMLVSNLRG